MRRGEPARSRPRPTGSFGVANAGKPAHAMLNIATGEGCSAPPPTPHYVPLRQRSRFRGPPPPWGPRVPGPAAHRRLRG